jgi:UrcA family protein
MKILLPLAALAAALTASPAFAQPSAPSPQIVHYADLDLSSPTGRRELDRRIGVAVREACGTASDADLHGRNLVQRCRVETRGAVAARRTAVLAAAESVPGDRFASGQ